MPLALTLPLTLTLPLALTRRDEAYLWADAAQLGAAELQPEKVVARGS